MTGRPEPPREDPGAAEQGEVVVGVDGNDAAVDHALWVAGVLRAPVRLVHVVPAYGMMPPLSMVVSAIIVGSGDELLAAAVSRAEHQAPDLEIRSSLRIGPRGAELAQAARGAQLVVLGRSGRTDHVLSGPTAERLTAHLACPLHVVPPDWESAGDRDRIVVGVKGADQLEHLLRRGMLWAGLTGAGVDVLHAGTRSEGRLGAELEQAVAIARIRAPGVPVHLRFVDDDPAEALVTASAEAGTVLLGRPPHQPTHRDLGAVARAVLRDSHCPVEIANPTSPPARAVTAARSGVRTEGPT